MALDLKTVYDIKNPPFTECPFCGDDTYYIKQHYSGDGDFLFCFDGSEADNSEMYSQLIETDRSKFAYCLGCNRKLFRYRK